MADANFNDMKGLVIHQQKQRIDYYLNAIGQALKATQADGITSWSRDGVWPNHLLV